MFYPHRYQLLIIPLTNKISEFLSALYTSLSANPSNKYSSYPELDSFIAEIETEIIQVQIEEEEEEKQEEENEKEEEKEEVKEEVESKNDNDKDKDKVDAKQDNTIQDITQISNDQCNLQINADQNITDLQKVQQLFHFLGLSRRRF